MATAGDMVTRALRLIGVLDATETPSAEDMVTGLDALNDMLHAWWSDNIIPGHVTLEQTDEIVLDDSALRAVRYSLAVELSIEYGRPLSEAIAAISEAEKKTLRIVNMTLTQAVFESGVTEHPMRDGYEW